MRIVSTPQAYDEPVEALEETLLFNLVYASTISDGVSSADVDDIISASHRHTSVKLLTAYIWFVIGIA